MKTINVGNDVFPVRTGDFQVNISKICAERDDDWGKIVAGRLASVVDLHAADALYHQQCSVNFRTLKNIPKQHSSSVTKRVNYGRPEDLNRSGAFQRTVEYFRENDEEQLTIADLIDKMQEFLEGSSCQAYSQVYRTGNSVKSRENALVILYNGDPGQNLNALRFSVKELQIC